MGNQLSSFNLAGKLILPNLKILTFHHPITAAELMFENPHTFIVEFGRPNPASKHLLPLPADHSLSPNNVYLMIPMSRSRANGIPVQEARRILSKARPMKSFVPLVGMCILGGREEEEEAEKVELLVNEEAAELMCGSWQYSSKGWKPSLGTIEEMNFEKIKVPHWLF